MPYFFKVGHFSSINKMKKAVVIGAGFGGIASAIRLVKKDIR